MALLNSRLFFSVLSIFSAFIVGPTEPPLIETVGDTSVQKTSSEGIDIDNFEGEVVREDQGEKVEEVFFFFFFSAFIVMPSELLFIEELGVKDSAMGPKADGIDINNFIGKIVRKDQGENFFEYHS